MSWADKAIANPMGYARAVLFPRGRDALQRYLAAGGRYVAPICICPQVGSLLAPEGISMEKLSKAFLDVDQTGMVLGTQMYGYRMDHNEDLDLDPLLTGWWLSPPHSPHRIISLGRHKILPLYGGGVFCTNDLNLAEELDKESRFPGGSHYAEKVEVVFEHLTEVVHARWAQIELWDRYLGDLLDRIPREQAMPWRCMRLAQPKARDALIRTLRKANIGVSLNYPSLGSSEHFPGGTWWGQRVISFPLGPLGEDNEKYIRHASEIISGVLELL